MTLLFKKKINCFGCRLYSDLKKVSLKRMDLMHKITDLAFNLVFRHLKVKEFCLTSAKPIKWVKFIKKKLTKTIILAICNN